MARIRNLGEIRLLEYSTLSWKPYRREQKHKYLVRLGIRLDQRGNGMLRRAIEGVKPFCCDTLFCYRTDANINGWTFAPACLEALTPTRDWLSCSRLGDLLGYLCLKVGDGTADEDGYCGVIFHRRPLQIRLRLGLAIPWEVEMERRFFDVEVIATSTNPLQDPGKLVDALARKLSKRWREIKEQTLA